jgi:hypothetical protein
MAKKRKATMLPSTDPDLHYPVSMPQAERESLAGDARLAEQRNKRRNKRKVSKQISPLTTL